MYASINNPKITKTIHEKKPPGFICEAAFFSVSHFLAKLWSDATFSAISYTIVLFPIMLFFLLSIVFNILKFLKLLHTEDLNDEAGLLSPKQIKLLFTVTRNLLGYFGVYLLSGELEKHLIQKELAMQNLGPAVLAL